MSPIKYKLGLFRSGQTGVHWTSIEIKRERATYTAVSREYADIIVTAESLGKAWDMAFALTCKRAGGVAICIDQER